MNPNGKGFYAYKKKGVFVFGWEAPNKIENKVSKEFAVWIIMRKNEFENLLYNKKMKRKK